MELIDHLFPSNSNFAYQMKSGQTTVLIRDQLLSESFIELLEMLESDNSDLISALALKVDKEEGKGLSSEDFTAALKTKLEGLSNYDDTELRGLISVLHNYDDTAIRNLIAALESNKLNKSDIIKKENISSNKTNDINPATVAAIMELIGDINYEDFLRTSDVQSSLTGTSTLPPSVEAINTALSGYIAAVDKRSSLTVAEEDQAVTDTKIPTVGAIRSALSNYNSDCIPNADKRTSLTAQSPETQSVTDTKVPTVKAVRDAISAAIPPAVTVDSAFDATSENPLQNKVITGRIQSETADTYTTSKIPTIAVVSSLISGALNSALAAYSTTDEKLKARKQSVSDSTNRPLLLGNFSSAETTDVTNTGLYNSNIYYNAANGELVAPSVVQTHSGNYYIVSGTTTPDNDTALADFGLHEVYIQYDE